MFGIRAVFLFSLVINVLVNGYQDDGNLDGELEVLLKRLQERLEDEERGHELEDLFERWITSGIEVDPSVAVIFNDMKLRHTNKWATFKIENKKKIVLDKIDFARGINADEAQFTEMKDKLTLEPRYVLFDFRFKSTKDGRVIKKIAFIFWCDDSARMGDKTIYASSKDTIKKHITGLGVEFQAYNKDEMDYETFRAEVQKKA